MAEKISGLTPGSIPLSGGELIEMVQSGVTYSTPVSAVDHNTLSGLQGGITSEYYHLSQSQHDYVIGGGVSTETAQVTASNNDIILADGTGGAFTVYLQESDNSIVIVKKIDAVNNITVEGLSGNIDGAANTTLTSQYESVLVIWDGTNWFIV